MTERFAPLIKSYYHTSLATPDEMKDGIWHTSASDIIKDWPMLAPQIPEHGGVWLTAKIPYLAKPALWASPFFYLYMVDSNATDIVFLKNMIKRAGLRKFAKKIPGFGRYQNWLLYRGAETLMPSTDNWLKFERVRIRPVRQIGPLEMDCAYVGKVVEPPHQVGDGKPIVMPFVSEMCWIVAYQRRGDNPNWAEDARGKSIRTLMEEWPLPPNPEFNLNLTVKDA